MTEAAVLLGGVSEASPNRQLAVVAARDLILGQFAIAEAPAITGRRVACVLETDSGAMVAGHNVEVENPPDFYHAEANTLASVTTFLGDVGIRAVYMGGKDPKLTGQQLKNITPCSDCYGLLAPRMTDNAELILFEPNTLAKATVFTADEFHPAYGTWPYSALTATNREDTLRELKEKTPLSEVDREVVADLRTLGLALGIKFYLTGTSSGRGWMSSAIHKKLGTKYGDMDILAISEKHGKEEIIRLVSEVVNAHYDDLEADEVETDFWVVCGENRGSQRHVNYVTLTQDGKKIMDLSWATNLKDGMLRDDYYANNCYHEIS